MDSSSGKLFGDGEKIFLWRRESNFCKKKLAPGQFLTGMGTRTSRRVKGFRGFFQSKTKKPTLPGTAFSLFPAFPEL
jgi:hypothetical protein